MHTRRAKTVIQTIGLLALGVFLFTNAFGLAIHNMGMQMDEGGNMLSCLFMGETALCQMNAFEHLSVWQNTFSTILSISTSAALLLALAWFIFAHHGKYRLQRHILSVQPSRAFNDLDLSLVDYLRQAFSQGILHPKIY